MNVEGGKNFIISASGGFDIGYSSTGKVIIARILVSSFRHLYIDN
jgi:hypothetical protein